MSNPGTKLGQMSRLTYQYWDEGLVKSSERVRDAGEVFTPFNIIEDMLDLLPADSWDYRPSKTYLEPSCGNGRFLVVVLYRKFAALKDVMESESSDLVRRTYALEALASIYGIDISEDNILGHEDVDSDGARKRILEHFRHLCSSHFDSTNLDSLASVADWILEHNVLVGNMLNFDSSGKPTNRDEMPVPDYKWDFEQKQVEIRFHKWAEIQEANRPKDDGMLDIFGSAEPEIHWKGSVGDLGSAPRVTWKPRGIIRRGAR